MSEVFSSKEVADRYVGGRALPDEAIGLWLDTLESALPSDRIRNLLDLGCGTGRFSSGLATRFRCPVLALDPSCAMISECPRVDRVYPVLARAEHIPLTGERMDLVWMSQAFHHLDSPEKAIAEVRRVLIPGGVLACRNATTETDCEAVWRSFFPETTEGSRGLIPSREKIVYLVSQAGFHLLAFKTVKQLFALSCNEYCEKIGQRALSPLLGITDEAFAAGMERLKVWAASQPADRAVREPLDLFVFVSTKGAASSKKRGSKVRHEKTG